jgi:hypothetical protein
MIGVKWTGLERFRKQLAAEEQKYKRALGGALYQEGTAIIAESQKIVPHEYGTLERSAYVAPPRDTAGGPMVEIGYGTSYAVKQHEEIAYRHREGRQAKYLETPFNKAMAGWKQRLAKRVRVLYATGSGFGGPA